MGDLTKLTVYLTPGATAALTEAAEVTGDTKTDTVNRALALYAEIVKTVPGGAVSFDICPGERRTVVVADGGGA